MQDKLQAVRFINQTGDRLKWHWSTPLMQSNSVSKAAWPCFILRPRFMNQTTNSSSLAESPNCWRGKSPLRTEAIRLAQNGSSNNQITLLCKFLVAYWKWITRTNLESNANVEEELILQFPCSGRSQSLRSPRMDTCTCKEQSEYKHKIH